MKSSYLTYIFGLLLYGSNGVVASLIGLSSYEMVLLRSFLGSLLLISIFFLTKQKMTALQNRKDLLYISISGIAMAADWLLLFEAYQHIGVGLALLINYCGPAIVMAFSPLILKERITWPKLVALFAALLGVFLISGQAAVGGASVYGLSCAGLSALAYAVMVLANKKSENVKGMENATIQLFVTFLAVAVFVGFASPKGLRIELAKSDWLPILWLGLLNTGGGCYFYFSAMGRLPAQTVAVLGYLEPLSAVLLSALFLSEVMLPLQILGAVFIIGGAVFGETVKQRKRATTQAVT